MTICATICLYFKIKVHASIHVVRTKAALEVRLQQSHGLSVGPIVHLGLEPAHSLSQRTRLARGPKASAVVDEFPESVVPAPEDDRSEGLDHERVVLPLLELVAQRGESVLAEGRLCAPHARVVLAAPQDDAARAGQPNGCKGCE